MRKQKISARIPEGFTADTANRIVRFCSRPGIQAKPENVAISVLSIIVGEIDDDRERKRVIGVFSKDVGRS